MVNNQRNVVSSGSSLYCFIRHIYSGPKENRFNVRHDFQRLLEKGELRPFPVHRRLAGPARRWPGPSASGGLQAPLAPELWGRRLGGAPGRSQELCEHWRGPQREGAPAPGLQTVGAASRCTTPLRGQVLLPQRWVPPRGPGPGSGNGNSNQPPRSQPRWRA